MTNENTVNVKTLEKYFKEKVDSEMRNIVDTVEIRIQKAILTAFNTIVAPKIELAIRSIKVSSRQDATSVRANSERREHVGINAFFENASGNNYASPVSNLNVETQNNLAPRGKWVVGLRNTIWPANTHSSHGDRQQGKQPNQNKSVSSLLDAF